MNLPDPSIPLIREISIGSLTAFLIIWLGRFFNHSYLKYDTQLKQNLTERIITLSNDLSKSHELIDRCHKKSMFLEQRLIQKDREIMELHMKLKGMED